MKIITLILFVTNINSMNSELEPGCFAPLHIIVPAIFCSGVPVADINSCIPKIPYEYQKLKKD